MIASVKIDGSNPTLPLTKIEVVINLGFILFFFSG